MDSSDCQPTPVGQDALVLQSGYHQIIAEIPVSPAIRIMEMALGHRLLLSQSKLQTKLSMKEDDESPLIHSTTYIKAFDKLHKNRSAPPRNLQGSNKQHPLSNSRRSPLRLISIPTIILQRDINLSLPPHSRRRANEPRINNSRLTPIPQSSSFSSHFAPVPGLLPFPTVNDSNPYATSTFRSHKRELEFIGDTVAMEGASGVRSGQFEYR